ncbi:MAG: efflux RND transporter permease subunit [Bdellovibrionota bacterium]|nr:efflux RND transporter permease subunit [Bdellovibrionota bacterium]
MIEVFVKRPAMTIVFILLFVLLGFVSFFNLNVEQSPRIDFPLVSVNVTYPGASPEEIETQIIKKVEDVVVEISEIKSIKSRAFENFGYVLVEFKLSADVNVKSSEVKDKVDAIVNDLPDGIDKPVVSRVDPFSKSVVEVALTSEKHTPKELFEFADKKLKNQFSKVAGVGTVDLFGGEEREIRVELDPVQMKSKYISINEVVTALSTQNLNVPGGNIERDKNNISVRFVGEFDSLEKIRKLPLKASDGNSFVLEEVAKVYDGSKKPETLSRFNLKPVVTMSIKKISDGNEVEVGEGIIGLLPELQKTLPDGMKIEVASDTSTFIVKETMNTLQGIGLGIVLTVLILFFFSGNWRLTVIAAVVIPSSVISALLLMDFSAFTINFITLLAMATSLGTLIANAIVIIESVMVHLEMGKSPQQAAIDGTKDVVIPVLASCGTNLVVFTPIAFMGGIIGQFMLQFGLSVVYATIFSLIASFTLTPMMCGALLKPIDKNEKKKENVLVRFTNSVVGFVLKEYKKIFAVMFKYPKTWMLLVLGSLVWTFSLAPYVGNEFIPTSDEDRVQINLTLPQGSTIWETSRVSKEVEALASKVPEVESTLAVLGENGTENAKIILSLKDKEFRTRSDVEVITELTPEVAKIPNVEAEFKRGDGGGGGNADISLNVLGDDYQEMVKISKRLNEIMRDSGYFRSLTSSYKAPKEEVQFIPDLSKLEQYGVNGALLGSTIRASIYGDDSNVFKEAGEEYDIRVEVGENYKGTPQDLQNIAILTSFGLVSLSDLGRFERTSAIPNIWRRDRFRIIQLNGYLAKSTAGLVQGELAAEFDKMEWPEGYSYQFVGNSESQEESGREIGKAFGLAILLTFMLLTAILNSFVHPLTISSSIITSFGGVFVLLFFFDSSINIASMLGIVMLVGLVVNNAILILDQTMVVQKRGVEDIQEALWQGIDEKFRAVLMTSIAIIAGALPQTWSPDLAKAAMGLVIIGGTAASIVYTFLLTPIVYWYLERLRRWVGAKKKSNTASV